MRPIYLALVVSIAFVTLGFPADENDVYVITTSERSLEQIEQLYAGIPPLDYKPPANRFRRLPRTRKLLIEGPVLRIVMLGDSIVNDTSRSCFDLVLNERLANCRIVKVTAVRGSTGCWWYKEKDRLDRYVLAHKPDLVIIGGISQRNDIESIRACIRCIRSHSNTEFLLMTGPFGAVNPLDDAQYGRIIDPNQYSDYRKGLEALAEEQSCGFLDMQAVWATYIRNAKRPLEDFKRDVVHANGQGEQILGRALAEHLLPPSPEASKPPQDPNEPVNPGG